MELQIAQQIGIGALAIVAGAAAWLLPYEWNLFRLRRGLSGLVSDRVNRLIPKVVGTILAAFGIAVIVGTAIVGSFKK